MSQSHSVLIPFPKQRGGPSTESERSTELPEWKVQLQEKVRAIRARKGLEATAQVAEPRATAVHEPPPEVARGPNPRAEAALNRRRRPHHEEAREAHALAAQPQVVTPPQPRPPTPVITEPPRIERAPAYTEKPPSISDSPLAADLAPSVAPEARTEAQQPAAPTSTPVAEMELDWDLTESDEYASEAGLIGEPPRDDAETAAAPTLPRELLDPIGFATFFRRLYAAVIDLGVIAFTCVPFVSSVELAGGDFSNRNVQLALGGLALVLGFLYLTVMLTVAGRSVGMMSAGLLALDAETMDLPTFTQATLRLIGLALGTAALFLGCFWSLFDRERRTWADLISRTAVRRVSESVYDSQEIRAPWLYRQRSRP